MSPGHLSAISKNLTYAHKGKLGMPVRGAIFHFCADDLVGCSCFPHVALCTLNANSRINRMFLIKRNCVAGDIPGFTEI